MTANLLRCWCGGQAKHTTYERPEGRQTSLYSVVTCKDCGLPTGERQVLYVDRAISVWNNRTYHAVES